MVDPVITSGFATERIIYSAALGLQLTPHRELGLGDGSSLTWQAGAAILLADKKLQVGPELYASTVLASGTSPLEAMLGARYRVDQFVFGAGVGAGLTGAASAAVWRGLVSLAWEPKPEPPKPAPVQVECPQPKDESATRDSDTDGIADKVDACQFVAGVASSESAKNGCPVDADGDAVADAQDACPAVPGLVDHNGCPPPADRDHDGIDDAEDVCPDVAGPVDSPKKGCPPETAALKEAHIELAERVEFGNDKAQLLGTSENVLRSVAQVMNAHPELAKVSIEGFTDNRGNAAYNVQLSADRAAAVLNWLAKNGVDKSRMVSKGFGADKPIASNDDEAGRQRNRRVEIRVLEYKAAQ